MQCNRTEIANVFGVAALTIDKYVREGMPYISRPTARGGKGHGWKFDSKSCIEWFVNRGKKGTKKADVEAAELRIKVAEATIKEVNAAERLKTMIHVEDVLTLQEEQFGVIKSALTDFPGRHSQALAVETDPAAVLRMLKEAINEILTDISGQDVDNPEPEEAEIDPDSDEKDPDSEDFDDESDLPEDGDDPGEDGNYGY